MVIKFVKSLAPKPPKKRTLFVVVDRLKNELLTNYDITSSKAARVRLAECQDGGSNLRQFVAYKGGVVQRFSIERFAWDAPPSLLLTASDVRRRREAMLCERKKGKKGKP